MSVHTIQQHLGYASSQHYYCWFEHNLHMLVDHMWTSTDIQDHTHWGHPWCKQQPADHRVSRLVAFMRFIYYTMEALSCLAVYLSWERRREMRSILFWWGWCKSPTFWISRDTLLFYHNMQAICRSSRGCMRNQMLGRSCAEVATFLSWEGSKVKHTYCSCLGVSLLLAPSWPLLR